MRNIPEIDLHPGAQGGPDSDSAVRACRLFIDKQRRSGFREMRIITGMGVRGDGTPRLRSRIEKDVLPPYSLQLEQLSYEQGGAVIRLCFKTILATTSSAQKRNHAKDSEHKLLISREERFQVTESRLDLVRQYLSENEIRKAAIKLNQVVKEHFPERDLFPKNKNALEKGLISIENELLEKGL